VQDGFSRLFDRDDLWQILMVLAFRKRCDPIQYERQKRRQPAGGRVYVDAVPEQDDGEAGVLLSNMLGCQPEPSLVVQVAEECRRMLAKLEDEQ
jgi:hypothetical protein